MIYYTDCINLVFTFAHLKQYQLTFESSMDKINFHEIIDERGVLISLESNRNIPFEIKRVYYLFGLSDKERGFHAHKNLKQILICLKGCCTIELDDGITSKLFTLNKPSEGIFIDKNIWRVMKDFSPDCLIMVLASDYYNESDYIRNYEEFISYITNGAL